MSGRGSEIENLDVKQLRQELDAYLEIGGPAFIHEKLRELERLRTENKALKDQILKSKLGDRIY